MPTVPSLTINKKSIATLFGEIKNHKFIIPEYQRFYAWKIEHCETMWMDILENSKLPNEYFFGTIVTFRDKKGNLQIIDGQQRITSFFLLLRALYKKLEKSDHQTKKSIIGLKNQIAPCIWDTNDITQEVDNSSLIHMESKAATDTEKEIFHEILKTGNYDEEAEDKYSINYGFFVSQSDEFAKEKPMEWDKLCVFILNKCIVLPIECDTEDTALTIFTTLNDRGQQLSDSDIFKAKLYRNCKTKNEKEIFTETWNELAETCEGAGIDVNDIFKHYMHIKRAKENNDKREIGLRRFYSADDYKYFKEKNVLNELIKLANFWWYVKYLEDPNSEEGYHISEEAKKWLHCLSKYPNEYWQFPVSVFFLKNYKNKDFNKNFCRLLRKEIAFLFAKFIIKPTINAIRDDVYNAYISINNGNDPKFKFDFPISTVEQRLVEHTSPALTPALLLLDAYLNNRQKSLINDFQIEHIFPKKWQNTNYKGWSKEDADIYLELYGNKVVIEKKLNILAGNGYFGKKKKKYAESKIANVKDLSRISQNDWKQADIEKREKRFCRTIINFIKKELSEKKYLK